MYIAGTIETVLTIALVFDIYTPYVAAIAAVHLLVAGAATYKVTKKWIWVIGGIEYCVFWMLACVGARHADLAQIDRPRRTEDRMINAAVVGLGTWGKTMVESLAAPAATSCVSRRCRPAP